MCASSGPAAAERPLAGAGGAEDLRAQVPGELHRGHADAAGGRVHQHLLARPEAGQVDQRRSRRSGTPPAPRPPARTTSRRASAPAAARSVTATGPNAAGDRPSTRSPGGQAGHARARPRATTPGALAADRPPSPGYHAEGDQHVAEVEPGGAHRDPHLARLQRPGRLRARDQRQAVQAALGRRVQPPPRRPRAGPACRWWPRGPAWAPAPSARSRTASCGSASAAQHRRAPAPRSRRDRAATNRPGCSDCAERSRPHTGARGQVPYLPSGPPPPRRGSPRRAAPRSAAHRPARPVRAPAPDASPTGRHRNAATAASSGAELSGRLHERLEPWPEARERSSRPAGGSRRSEPSAGSSRTRCRGADPTRSAPPGPRTRHSRRPPGAGRTGPARAPRRPRPAPAERRAAAVHSTRNSDIATGTGGGELLRRGRPRDQRAAPWRRARPRRRPATATGVAGPIGAAGPARAAAPVACRDTPVQANGRLTAIVGGVQQRPRVQRRVEQRRVQAVQLGVGVACSGSATSAKTSSPRRHAACSPWNAGP